jgi:TonB family protein
MKGSEAVASNDKTIMKGPASWEWQEPYLRALREKAPDRLAEQLVIAEKAILARLQLLRDAPDNLPEILALRKALDSLYSLMPRKYDHSGEVMEDPEDYEGKRLNWTNLGILIGLAILLSFTAGWILSRRNTANVQTMQAGNDRAEGVANSDNGTTASIPEVHILDAPPPGYRAKAPFALDVPAAPAVVNKNANAQPETNARSANSAISREQQTPPEKARTRGTIEPVPTSATERPSSRVAQTPSNPILGGAPPRPEGSADTFPAPSNPPNAVAQGREEHQATPQPPVEAQAKPQIPSGTVSVSFGTYPSIRVPPELKSQASAASLQIGSLISRVEPIYPEDARRQNIEGTVKVHAIVGKDGAVQGMEGISGPPLLVSAALSALRQWHYKPTLLGDQPIETGQDITIVFQLAKEAAISN